MMESNGLSPANTTTTCNFGQLFSYLIILLFFAKLLIAVSFFELELHYHITTIVSENTM